MPSLNWKNVTGSRLDTGADSLSEAGSLFSKAFENFSGAEEDRNKRLTKAGTEEQLNKLRGITSVDQYNQEIGDFDLGSTGEYVNAEAVNKARAALLPALQKREQTEAARIQGLEDAQTSRERSQYAHDALVKATNRQEDTYQRGLGIDQAVQSNLGVRDIEQSNVPLDVQAGQLTEQQYPGAFTVTEDGVIQQGPNFSPEAAAAHEENRQAVGVRAAPELQDRYDELDKALPKGTTSEERARARGLILDSHNSNKLEGRRKVDLDRDVAAIVTRSTSEQANIKNKLERYIASNPLDKPQTTSERVESFNKLKDKYIAAGKSDDGSNVPGFVGRDDLTKVLDDLQQQYPNLRAEYVEQFLRTAEVGGSGFFEWDLAYDEDQLRDGVAAFMAANPDGSRQTLVEQARNRAASDVAELQKKELNDIRTTTNVHEVRGGVSQLDKNVGYGNTRTNSAVNKLRSTAKTKIDEPVAKTNLSNKVKARLNKELEKVSRTKDIDITLGNNELNRAIQRAWESKNVTSTDPDALRRQRAEFTVETRKHINNLRAMSANLKEAEDTLEAGRNRKRGKLSASKIDELETEIKQLKAALKR